MGLFDQLVRTAVNVAITPVAVVQDVAAVAKTALGDSMPKSSHTMEHLERLKREAADGGPDDGQ